MISPKILGNKIRTLREEMRMSQEDLSKKVDVSRVAISQIEQGKRRIEFLELAKIAKVFELKTDFFLVDETLPHIAIVEDDRRPIFFPEKLKSVILYILGKCAGKPNIGETVFYKLLYFIDFDYFELYKKSLTGLSYIHLQYGPVPARNQYLPVIDRMRSEQNLKIIIQDYHGMKIKRYINLIEYKINSLEAREISVIDEVLRSLSDWSARKIEDYVHGDAPWRLTSEGAIISYYLVFERQVPYTKVDDDFRQFHLMNAKDILKEIGPISQEDYDYYERL